LISRYSGGSRGALFVVRGVTKFESLTFWSFQTSLPQGSVTFPGTRLRFMYCISQIN
jgi:hypothetical protein